MLCKDILTKNGSSTNDSDKNNGLSSNDSE